MLQYACYVSNRLRSFDVGMIYLLNVDKCMHHVNGGTRSNFNRFYCGVKLSRLLETSAIREFVCVLYLKGVPISP